MSHWWLKPPRRSSGRSVEPLPGVKSGRRIKTLLLGLIGPWSVKSWASGSMRALWPHPRMMGPAVSVALGYAVPSSGARGGLVRPSRARGCGVSRRASAHLIRGHRSCRARMSWPSSSGSHVRRSSGIGSARLGARGVRRRVRSSSSSRRRRVVHVPLLLLGHGLCLALILSAVLAPHHASVAWLLLVAVLVLMGPEGGDALLQVGRRGVHLLQPLLPLALVVLELVLVRVGLELLLPQLEVPVPVLVDGRELLLLRLVVFQLHVQ